MSSVYIKYAMVWFLFLGVVLGMIGTYLMTTAYHAFPRGELIMNFFDVVRRVVTLRFKSAGKTVKAVAVAGERLGTERRDLSLTGIYFLFASFIFQVVSAGFAIWDVYRGVTETVTSVAR